MKHSGLNFLGLVGSFFYVLVHCGMIYSTFWKVIYLREKESTCVGGVGQRERERKTPADSTLSLEPVVGLSLVTLRL